MLVAGLTWAGNVREGGSTYALASRGEEYLDQGEWENAIEAFSAALDKDDTLLSLYVYRGEAYMRLGDYGSARQDFETVIQADTWDEVLVAAYSGRGRIAMIEGNPQDALQDFNQAILLNPDDAYSHFVRGMAYYELMQPDLSEQELTLALDLGLDDPTLVETANDLLELLAY
jgi:tetratricopeptide (TPR) repeat protein